eukprot:gnl/TRDRNA2_/TRDRNA2_36420_c0_seq1.p1 gnl/TRDRNA2_/TRDRNA2_36420_c0~~gnl/TRDRNA2_/TRDRNA2_36420_c0_seq1.p1  ORF type:complete len:522 (+),score=85.04 gnl/TRDRNA2_/TRDRNA2_36420_c0_seq1:88-1653(+)
MAKPFILQPTTQYVDIFTPRNSLASEGRPERNCDENDDRIANMDILREKGDDKALKKRPATARAALGPRCATPPKRCATPPKRSAAEPLGGNYIMPCLRPSTPGRPSTPVRASTPKSRTAQESENSTSGAAMPPVRPLPMTPGRRLGAGCSVGASELDDGASVVSASACSEVSGSSRWDQLSRRTVSTRRCLSSAEMQQIEVEQKKQEVHEQIKKNRLGCRKALAADAGFGITKATNITVPKEFNLSTARPARKPETSVYEDPMRSPMLRGRWSTASSSTLSTQRLSVDRWTAPATPRSTAPATPGRPSTPGRNSTAPPATPGKKPWRPELTVPKGPLLGAERREMERRNSIGSGAPRRSSSCSDLPMSEDGSSHRTLRQRPSSPFMRKRADSAERSATTSTAPAVLNDLPPLPADATEEERAQHARLKALQQKDQEAATKKPQLCVFKRAGNAGRITARTGGGAPLSARGSNSGHEDSICSVGSMHELHSEATPNSARKQRPPFGAATSRPCLTPMSARF